MKHMKQFAMVAIIIALAVGGYMAYKHCCVKAEDEVKVQFLNFGGNYDGDDFHHNSSYNAGYEAGMNDCQNS